MPSSYADSVSPRSATLLTFLKGYVDAVQLRYSSPNFKFTIQIYLHEQ